MSLQILVNDQWSCQVGLGHVMSGQKRTPPFGQDQTDQGVMVTIAQIEALLRAAKVRSSESALEEKILAEKNLLIGANFSVFKIR